MDQQSTPPPKLPPDPYSRPYYPPPPPQKSTWPWVVGGVVGVIVLGQMIGTHDFVDGGSSAGVAQQGVPVTRYVAPAAPIAPPAPSGPVTTIMSGTYEVGTGDGQIPPGTWKTTGPSRPGNFWASCYYARLSSTDGELGSINANDNFEGPQTVTIKTSDAAFEVSGDCTWTKVR